MAAADVRGLTAANEPGVPATEVSTADMSATEVSTVDVSATDVGTATTTATTTMFMVLGVGWRRHQRK